MKNHPFFSLIDWVKLEAKEIQPIFVPKIENSLDLSNIDRFFTREDATETPTEDSSILKKEKFDQFTYINENGFIPQQKNSMCEQDVSLLGKNSLT